MFQSSLIFKCISFRCKKISIIKLLEWHWTLTRLQTSFKLDSILETVIYQESRDGFFVGEKFCYFALSESIFRECLLSWHVVGINLFYSPTLVLQIVMQIVPVWSPIRRTHFIACCNQLLQGSVMTITKGNILGRLFSAKQLTLTEQKIKPFYQLTLSARLIWPKNNLNAQFSRRCRLF